VLAAFGELHPRVVKAFDLPRAAFAAEIYLDGIPQARQAARTRPAYSPAPLQAVTRDFAFIVPPSLSAGNLMRAIRGADRSTITDVHLFDRFETADGLSLALEVTLQPVEKSFTDEEIAQVSRRIIAAAEKLGAHLRS
jgi:phenylalanyl-tRNA synthetase beta chain